MSQASVLDAIDGPKAGALLGASGRAERPIETSQWDRGVFVRD